jgi:hypothetical protein
MKTIQISGIISFEWGDWNKLKLIQEDGYKIDLVGRFSEVYESFKKQSVQVSYWLSDKPCSKDEITQGFLKHLFGYIDAEYEKNPYAYSSWTSGVDYDTCLKVGGHDLFNELQAENGRFIIIELSFKNTNNHE